jgi:hypothetical protein
MTHIEQAIRDAWGEGYKPEWISQNVTEHWFGLSENNTMSLSATFLDPAFWQALTIAKGWDVKDGTMRCEHYNPRYNEPGQRGCNADKCEYAGYKNWKDIFRHFIDHLIEGGDAESFFKDL